MSVSGGDFATFLSVPRVAASFWQKTDKNTLAQYCAAGLEIAEIRLDKAAVQDSATAKEIIAAYSSSMPTILTIRSQFEGGEWQESEDKRLQLFSELSPLCDAVDIELAADILPQVVDIVKENNKALIISRHNFNGCDTLADITQSAKSAFACGADVFKNACVVNSENDFFILREVLQKWQGGTTVIIGMGESEFARRARLQLMQEGSRIAFAAIGHKSAPGQLSLEETAAAANIARKAIR